MATTTNTHKRARPDEVEEGEVVEVEEVGEEEERSPSPDKLFVGSLANQGRLKRQQMWTSEYAWKPAKDAHVVMVHLDRDDASSSIDLTPLTTYVVPLAVLSEGERATIKAWIQHPEYPSPESSMSAKRKFPGQETADAAHQVMVDRGVEVPFDTLGTYNLSPTDGSFVFRHLPFFG